jgi:hypothetical protein
MLMRLIDLWHGYSSSGTACGMDTIVLGQHVPMEKKIITRQHFTRKPLCKIKMCHVEGKGENECLSSKLPSGVGER